MSLVFCCSCTLFLFYDFLSFPPQNPIITYLVQTNEDNKVPKKQDGEGSKNNGGQLQADITTAKEKVAGACFLIVHPPVAVPIHSLALTCKVQLPISSILCLTSRSHVQVLYFLTRSKSDVTIVLAMRQGIY